MIYNFIIFSLARSGSHMLATALNNHPAVWCEGEWAGNLCKPNQLLEPKRYKAIKGCILHPPLLNVPMDENTKLIWLDRDIKEISLSLGNASANQYHYDFPATIQPCLTDRLRPSLMSLEMRHKELKEFFSDKSHLYIEYNDLTGNKDVRELHHSDLICDFIGINKQPLIPSTYKPTVELKCVS